MTMTTETILSPVALATPGVWYTADIEESSFVDDVKIRINGSGPAEAKYVLRGGREYVYRISDEVATMLWNDLSNQSSPGQTFTWIRGEADDFRAQAATYKPTPVLNASVTITGPAATIDFVVAHAQALGLTIR
jgi:hypothetical protein